MFFCHDVANSCISKRWTCNGEVDCPNGFDEKVELCNKTTQAISGNNSETEVTSATITSMLTLLGHVIAQNQQLSQEIAKLNTILKANNNATTDAMDWVEERLQLIRNTRCKCP